MAESNPETEKVVVAIKKSVKTIIAGIKRADATINDGITLFSGKLVGALLVVAVAVFIYDRALQQKKAH